MNFTRTDVETLRSILTLCKTVGVDSVVLSGGKVMGAASSKKLAIIAQSELEGLDIATPIGIGRLAELEKRLSLFQGDVNITGEVGKSGEIMRLTMAAGKSKAQFRCSATSMIPHPKSNDDVPLVVVSLSKTEISTLTKAAKIFGAENIIFKISSSGAVHIECVDDSNDQFSTVAERSAEFTDDTDNCLFTYSANYINTVLETAVKDADEADLVFGQSGSITILVKGYSLMIMPNINED